MSNTVINQIFMTSKKVTLMTFAEIALSIPPYKNPTGDFGRCVLRDLTALEIDQLDFMGKVPELNMPVRQTAATLSVKAQRAVKHPCRKSGLRFGLARTA